MPDYEHELRALADHLRLCPSLMFLGDRSDVPRLLSGLDVFVWLSQGEGMPHVISEAGAAKLPLSPPAIMALSSRSLMARLVCLFRTVLPLR